MANDGLRFLGFARNDMAGSCASQLVFDRLPGMRSLPVPRGYRVSPVRRGGVSVDRDTNAWRPLWPRCGVAVRHSAGVCRNFRVATAIRRLRFLGFARNDMAGFRASLLGVERLRGMRCPPVPRGYRVSPVRRGGVSADRARNAWRPLWATLWWDGPQLCGSVPRVSGCHGHPAPQVSRLRSK